MWNMASHDGKSNGMCGPPKNKSKCRPNRKRRGWRSTAGADLITAKAFVLLLVKVEEGTLWIFPCCSVASLSFPLLLSLRSMAPGWFHSSLHCHPEQINVTMRKARAALFLRRANSLLESLSDLLYSLSPPLSRTVRKEQAILSPSQAELWSKL